MTFEVDSRDQRSDSVRARPLPSWAGGLSALMLVYAPPLVAVISGNNEIRSLLSVGFLVLSLLPIVALTIAAPIYGMQRGAAFWRLIWPVTGFVFIWRLGVEAGASVNRASH